MNNYFVFNISSEHSLLNKEKKIISLTNFENKLRVKPEDNFVTLDDQGEYVFNHYGVITNEIKTTETQLTEKEIKEGKKGRKFLHEIPVNTNDINEKLDDYQYSLIAIRNYLNPHVHFKRKYTSLTEDDYHTITQKLVYLSRTTFGRLYNCLPIENQFDSLLSMISLYKKPNLREIGYLEAIKFLKEYIQENVVDTGKYLVKINDMFENSFKGLNITEEICFSFEENLEQGFNINRQALLFKDLFDLMFDLELVEKLKEQIETHFASENRFDQLFNRRGWPINIRI